jgi:hypothetical protein
VAVSSSNSPRFEANPNTGKPVRSGKEARVARNTLHLSWKYPSRAVLPVREAANLAAGCAAPGYAGGSASAFAPMGGRPSGHLPVGVERDSRII